jgi:hypothetical protein
MAENQDAGLLPRTYFRAPRVPFDFRALALGIAGFLVYKLGGQGLSAIFEPESLREGMKGGYDLPGAFVCWGMKLIDQLPYIGAEIGRLAHHALRIEAGSSAGYTWWEILLGGAWFLGVWSFFALAIHRITTLRIARDEGLSLGEAVRFAVRNWPTLLLAPVIVTGVIAIFFGCNALAGLVQSIPVLGGILSIILVPLAIISTLLIVLVGVGGVFGLPLISAAASWECNGSLDAISRAFSYLFARPLQYFWNFFLIFLFTGLIVLVGTFFTHTLAKSLDAGNVSDVMTVMLDPPHYDRPVHEGTAWSELSTEAQTAYKAMDLDDPGLHPAPGDWSFLPPAMDLRNIGHVGWTYKLNVLVLWLLLNIIWYGISGYALYWLIGASSCVYADLRADVDGTEEDEVFLEDEQEDLDALAEDGPAVEGEAAQAEEAAAADAQAAQGEDPAAAEPPETGASEPETPEGGEDEASGPSESPPEAPPETT